MGSVKSHYGLGEFEPVAYYVKAGHTDPRKGQVSERLADESTAVDYAERLAQDEGFHSVVMVIAHDTHCGAVRIFKGGLGFCEDDLRSAFPGWRSPAAPHHIPEAMYETRYETVLGPDGEEQTVETLVRVEYDDEFAAYEGRNPEGDGTPPVKRAA